MLQRGMVRALTALLLATLAAGAASEGDSATWELTRGYDLCGSATLPPTLEAGLNRARDAAFDPRGSGTLWLASSAAASLRAVTLGGAPLREIPYDALVEGASRVSSFFCPLGHAISRASLLHDARYINGRLVRGSGCPTKNQTIPLPVPCEIIHTVTLDRVWVPITALKVFVPTPQGPGWRVR